MANKQDHPDRDGTSQAQARHPYHSFLKMGMVYTNFQVKNFPFSNPVIQEGSPQAPPIRFKSMA